MDVLWRNRPAEINSLKIEDCYFEQKPDRHRPFVVDERVWSVYELVCVCVCVCLS